jgi:hypothetical protein
MRAKLARRPFQCRALTTAELRLPQHAPHWGVSIPRRLGSSHADLVLPAPAPRRGPSPPPPTRTHMQVPVGQRLPRICSRLPGATAPAPAAAAARPRRRSAQCYCSFRDQWAGSWQRHVIQQPLVLPARAVSLQIDALPLLPAAGALPGQGCSRRRHRHAAARARSHAVLHKAGAGRGAAAAAGAAGGARGRAVTGGGGGSMTARRRHGDSWTISGVVPRGALSTQPWTLMRVFLPRGVSCLP